MVGVDKWPDGVVPEIVAGGLLGGMTEEYAGDGKEFQEVEVWDTRFRGLVHNLYKG